MVGTALALALVVATVVAWRWAPRPAEPASAQMRAAASNLAGQPPPHGAMPTPPLSPRTDRERVLARAFALRGVPYKFGAKGPENLDCSGFTKEAFAAAGVELPDGSFNQASGEKPLDTPSVLSPGDLVFYRWAGADRITHVTMYAGDGWLIGTGSPGQPKEVVIYPFADDLKSDGRVITYRHITLPDE